MDLIRDEEGAVCGAALTGRELRELVAFEVDRSRLEVGAPAALLRQILLEYGIPPERMAGLLGKPALSRGDVWELQLLKRRSRGDARAAATVEELRSVEERCGVPLPELLPGIWRAAIATSAAPVWPRARS
jgi:hypothetical protein